MSKDVIDDRYARLYEIPLQLARLGNQVLALTFGYQGQKTGIWRHDATPGDLEWRASSVRFANFLDSLAYPNRCLTELANFKPNILIGASDIPHAALVHWLARKLDIPFVVDLYDNFESFGQARIPGMKRLLRASVKHADLVTTTSNALAELVTREYAPKGHTLSLPSSVDFSIFKRMDRDECRRALGLPPRAPLIGTAGGLYLDKGIGTLLDAWPQIRQARPDAHLVLAGPHSAELNVSDETNNIHYLGKIPHQRTALLFNALDVGVIYLRDTPFGRYCFPQKAYEMLACGLPPVAARVGEMAELLNAYPQCLYTPDDPASLCKNVLKQLAERAFPDVCVQDWKSLISQLDVEIRKIPAIANTSARNAITSSACSS